LTRRIVISTLWALLVGVASAQEPVVSDTLGLRFARPADNLWRTSYDKRLGSHRLDADLVFGIETGDFYADVNERFASTVVKGAGDAIRDNQRFELVLGYAPEENYRFGVATNHKFFSDSRRVEINDGASAGAELFAKYVPLSDLYFAASGGYVTDRQVGEEDAGAAYGFEGRLERRSFGDARVSSAILFRNEDVSPRKITDRTAYLLVENEFEEDVTTSLSGRYQEAGRSFYFEADSAVADLFGVRNNIRRRDERSFWFDGDASFRLSPTLDASLDAAAYTRTVKRDTRHKNLDAVAPSVFDDEIEELRFGGGGDVAYRANAFGARAAASYSERDERHNAVPIENANPIFYEERVETEKRKNNRSRRAQLSLSALYAFSETESILFEASHNKLWYDTPSDLNFDDRDELLSMFSARYKNRLTPFFDAFADLETTFGQTSYLFAERSSNNHANRVIKLRLGGDYRGARLSSKNEFLVSANYTEYDYQDLNPNYRSYALRQALFSDSTTAILSERVALRFEGRYKTTEQGDLNWRGFTMNPNRRVDETTAIVAVETRYSKIVFAFGARFFSLETSSIDRGETVDRSLFESVGPVSRIEYRAGGRVRLFFDGLYEFVNNKGKREERASFDFSATWRL
jgi:hypothetical protein